MRINYLCDSCSERPKICTLKDTAEKTTLVMQCVAVVVDVVVVVMKLFVKICEIHRMYEAKVYA